jgi:DNA repair exonuclease SbcCD ATPase subunit
MADKNPSEFRFNGDDQETENFYHEELKDLRVEKLSQRVTLLTILLPCLVAVIIYFGYQTLSDRVSQIHDTGALEIQRLTEKLEDLSKNFNEKLIAFSTTLSTQDKDFGTTIEGRLFAINKNIDKLQHDIKSINEDLKRDLKQNQDTIDKLIASKADKKSQAVAVEKINAAIEPLEKEIPKLKALGQDLKTASNSMAKLESSLTAKLEALAAASQQHSKNYEQLQASLTELKDNATKLSNITVDKDALALEIFKLRINLQNQIDREITDINQRLDAIQKEVGGSETISATQKQSLKKVSKNTVSQKSGTASKTGTAGTAAPTQSRTITEKDLIE